MDGHDSSGEGGSVPGRFRGPTVGVAGPRARTSRAGRARAGAKRAGRAAGPPSAFELVA